MSAHTIRQHFAPSNCPDPIVRMHDESRRHIPFGIVDAVSRSSNSNQNAKSLPTPHISGSYRLRRHFPRYCDVSTRIRTPIGFLSFGLGPRAPATGASAVRTTGLLTFRSGNPFRNARSDAAVPALRTVGVQSLLHTGLSTSWPSSLPGSGPSKPSRGTGYG